LYEVEPPASERRNLNINKERGFLRRKESGRLKANTSPGTSEPTLDRQRAKAKNSAGRNNTTRAEKNEIAYISGAKRTGPSKATTMRGWESNLAPQERILKRLGGGWTTDKISPSKFAGRALKHSES